ncbi:MULTISPECIES: caspase family protein [Streptomyces]|uniref:caspase family protein n=1 Tax=Streptomyces TaxID=1883 RepID=UPI00287FCB7A|nr:caspase family protein [Streptomyces sp. CGMCC 4.1456]WNF66009.1 caspase family protein [Streptomyces sp. CGMCC 4.1456]
MRTVYALFVGIDDYPGAPLRGCVNDVRAAETWLRGRTGPEPRVRTLYDARATRAAVLAGLEEHLGRSGPGDTALLWFSGHGSQSPTSDPGEATGWSQALVCHDSLVPGGQPVLRDTELGALLDGIAARGTHVVAVLDCCHSGGATREYADGPDGAAVRGVPWQSWWHTGSREGGGPGPEPGRHVLLAACRPQELAHEKVIDGLTRGMFSHALLSALDGLGPTTTYGEAHALAHARVRVSGHIQHPELRGPEDGGFLSGEPVPASPFLLRHTAWGWEVNCGAAHGLRSAGAEFTLSGAAGERTVVVREVRTESALVDPVDWQPTAEDEQVAHAVTPSALAFPPAVVTLSGEPAAVRLVAEAVAAVPALALEPDGPPAPEGAVRLHVEAGYGRARVSGGAGYPVPDLPLRSPADAAGVTDCLAHIARWHHIRDLANPDPLLSSLVRITVEETSVGGLSHSADGEVVCAYTPDGREPQVRVGIHNFSGRQLWAVLLDLTDGYASSPHLFEGEFIGDGRVGWARRGQPVWLRLPPGRSTVRGASTRDWLKVIVAEDELNLAPFRLPAWSTAAPSGARLSPAPAGGGGLLRLIGAGARDGRDAGGPAYGYDRDAGGPACGAARWGTAQVVVRTQV